MEAQNSLQRGFEAILSKLAHCFSTPCCVTSVQFGPSLSSGRGQLGFWGCQCSPKSRNHCSVDKWPEVLGWWPAFPDLTGPIKFPAPEPHLLPS